VVLVAGLVAQNCSVCKVDEFTKRWLDIYETTQSEGVAQARLVLWLSFSFRVLPAARLLRDVHHSFSFACGDQCVRAFLRACAQPISLGLHRSDYMINEAKDKVNAPCLLGVFLS
jgi:uncharacterized membrane protein